MTITSKRVFWIGDTRDGSMSVFRADDISFIHGKGHEFTIIMRNGTRVDVHGDPGSSVTIETVRDEWMRMLDESSVD